MFTFYVLSFMKNFYSVSQSWFGLRVKGHIVESGRPTAALDQLRVVAMSTMSDPDLQTDRDCRGVRNGEQGGHISPEMPMLKNFLRGFW